MKQIAAISLLTLASLATLNSAVAQDRGVQADVPFTFSVGNATLPSGNYTVTSESTGVIMIQNRATHATAFTAVSRDSNAPKTAHLLFHKYGDQYFLAQISCPYAAVNAFVPTSKQEKKVRLQEAAIATEQTTLVALK